MSKDNINDDKFSRCGNKRIIARKIYRSNSIELGKIDNNDISLFSIPERMTIDYYVIQM